MSGLLARIARRRTGAEAKASGRRPVSALLARIARRRTGAEAAASGRRPVSALFARLGPLRRGGAKADPAADPDTDVPAGARSAGAPAGDTDTATGAGVPARRRRSARELYDRLPHRRVAAKRPTEDPPTQALAVEAAPAQAPPDGSDEQTRQLPLDGSPAASAKASVRNRGRLRRRMRYLRRVRELQRRDLGGLVFELQRLGQRRDELVTTKIGRLDATERELRALEDLLEAGQQLEDVREPGIGGTCPSCGELHGSSDRFCAACGVPLAALASATRKP